MKLFKKFYSTNKIDNKRTKEDIENTQEIAKKNDVVMFNTNRKHLLCDDSEINRLILKKYLNLKNITCDEATDGIDCIDQIKKNGVYDIIWMDIQMPRMNGFECVKVLRNEYNYDGVIIGLTGYIDQNSINTALTTGMNHIIGKPINKDILYTYVSKYNGVSDYNNVNI